MINSRMEKDQTLPPPPYPKNYFGEGGGRACADPENFFGGGDGCESPISGNFTM